MRALLVPLDEVAVVLGVVDGGLVVVAREGLHGVQRVPEGERDELGEVADVAAEHPGAAVARRLRVAGQAGRLDVVPVLVAVPAADGASPDAGYQAPRALNTAGRVFSRID